MPLLPTKVIIEKGRFLGVYDVGEPRCGVDEASEYNNDSKLVNGPNFSGIKRSPV